MAVIPPLTRRYSSEFHQAVQDGLNCATPSSRFSRKTVRRFSSEFHNTAVRTKRTNLSLEDDIRKRSISFQGRSEQNWLFSSYEREYKSNRDVLSSVCYASDSDSAERHQKSLDAYLESLQRQDGSGSSKAESGISEFEDQSRQLEARKGLETLDRYISIVKDEAKSEERIPFTTGRNSSRMTENSAVGYMNVTKQKSIYARESKSSSLFNLKDSTNLYLISILVSMNIAVFLFEIASPIKNSDSNLWSLPLMYGAKVNDLIMVGEWWRLVTPMFLHAGVLHIGLSSWVLLSFGPQVCRGYGAFTFFLIYLLGGISGNFISFLHTSDPTVGGSGPAFAVIGAWLIYQSQNKDITGKENYENMYQKAIIATASTFVLANFGPIDNWTSLGAAISGIIYGFFTSPVVEIDDASASGDRNRMKEEMMTLIKQTANPCKSLLIFTIFVSVFSSFILFYESPLGTLELEELVRIVE